MTHHTTPLMVQSLVWIIMNISTKENQIINTKLLYIVIHTFIPWFGIYKYLDFLEFYGNFMKEFLKSGVINFQKNKKRELMQRFCFAPLNFT